MITPDDNARKNYERVKRWREKNRALVNLKQRNYRREKKNLPVPVLADPQSQATRDPEVRNNCGEARESKAGKPPDAHSKPRLDSRGGQNLSGGSDRRAGDENHGRSQEPASPPAQTSKDETLDRLRGLIKVEQEKPAVEVSTAVPARFGTYRDDGGRPITERAWNELQKKKDRAEKGGYVYDEFSQA